MKRLPTATSFSLVLMFIGTSIAFAGSFWDSPTDVAGQQPTATARNIAAGFTKSWTDKCSKKF